MNDLKQRGGHRATADTKVLSWSVFGIFKESRETGVAGVELAREMGKIAKDQITYQLVGHGKEYGCYSERKSSKLHFQEVT